MVLLNLPLWAQSGFFTEQKKYSRVREAIKDKEQIVLNSLKENKLLPNDLRILIVAYKNESKLTIFAKKETEATYKKLKTYDICSKSGQLGPKRKKGDFQVPEGFYHIDRFNPYSSFFLSLGINYPNLSDRRKSNAKDLGGDIFIHGDCVTIGCLPMTNDKIKEIYLYAAYAKNSGQSKIPVYIFPFRMTEENFLNFNKKYKDHKNRIAFWENLKTGFDLFEKEKKELNVRISKTGDYLFD